jgi:hypothetical protein
MKGNEPLICQLKETLGKGPFLVRWNVIRSKINYGGVLLAHPKELRTRSLATQPRRCWNPFGKFYVITGVAASRDTGSAWGGFDGY